AGAAPVPSGPESGGIAMASEPTNEDIEATLRQLGIAVPQEDIPFLRRSFLRQQELLHRHAERLAPETEPAHIFRPLP
ncbi:MAG: hypothetical protein WBA83_14065, partial [Burkholderiaceae bacterium]